MTEHDAQTPLFAATPRTLPPAPIALLERELAERMPSSIRLGTTSWTYPAWEGTVYGSRISERDLAAFGLTAYARHPLLRVVEVDRTYYAPMSAAALRVLASQVPEDFRFVVKAHEDCVTRRFPHHARYGQKRGDANGRYLDASFAADAVVAPFAEGLEGRGSVVLFQFPPHEVRSPEQFAEELHDFLVKLPKGILYAVEVRNRELLVPEYATAIRDAGAVHCHNAWAAMPPVTVQARALAPVARNPLVVRWLLRPGDTFESARDRYTPFGRLVDEDSITRAAIADLVARASLHGVPAFVLVDNKAEGCAPRSVARLAEAIVENSGRLRSDA